MASDKKKESVFEWAALFGLFVVILVTLFWLFGNHKIVYSSTKPLYYLAHPWKWFGYEKEWSYIFNTAGTFYQHPAKVQFFDWTRFANTAMKPAAVFVSVICMLVALALATFRTGGLKKRLQANELLKIVSGKFTGVLPVLAIRADLVANKNPRWRRIEQPEEYMQRITLPGSRRKLLQVMPGDKPETGKYTLEEVSLVLEGIVGNYKANGNTYLVSNTLGRQVVDLLKDSELYNKVVFPDRFSNEGKVVFALFCAQAFGGAEGKADYAEYRDRLNRAAYGDKNGMTNLSIAQPLYEKYRTNPLAQKLFALHNWEYTYLTELVRQAKRQGKAGHWEIMWLLPTNRAMFFSIQNLGMKTPSVENASAFNQYLYERACARLNRLPIERAKHVDEKGQESVILQSTIFVEGAVEGLDNDWKRWCENTDDIEDVWKNTEVWKQVNQSLLKEYENINTALKATTGVKAENSDYDSQMKMEANGQDTGKSVDKNKSAGFDFL